MKNCFNILILVLSLTSLSAQTTPNGTDISSYIVNKPALTDPQISWINTQIANNYPNVINLDEPTTDYNCHNYAFVKSEGGSELWLDTLGDDVFWLPLTPVRRVRSLGRKVGFSSIRP